MSTDKQTQSNNHDSPGNRLSLILDQIGFKQGRGRVIDFQTYLKKTSPQFFKDLKYTTVRAWFQDHAPPMRKIDAIFDALLVEFSFQHNISHIKTWWKAGGPYPFCDEIPAELMSLHRKINAVKEKLPLTVMSIVREETGEHFKALSGSDLIHISDKTANFAEDFLNPFSIECPDEYLRLVVRYELTEILNKDTD
ncbi:MAG: hypothetical protein PVI92_06630 [Chromatiales bacterium]|jgi:hypothetical protein